MNRFSSKCLISLVAVMALSLVVRAEDAQPAQPKAPDQPAPGGARAQGQQGQQGGNRFGGRGNWQGGNNNGGNFGANGLGGMINNVLGGLGRGGAGGVDGIISRMLGFDLEDPKADPKLDQLPLGVSKRMVMEVPVGGVDNFNPTGAGWKVETVFKATPEQTKSIEGLRDEYAAEQKKLNQEILEAQKALAQKVVDLRKKYEVKANEVLTGTDKDAKEKMDALATELYTKNAATVAETLPLYDPKDTQQRLTMIRALREKTTKATQEAEDKLLALIPEDNRPKFQEALKAQADARATQDRLLQFGGGNNNGATRQRGQGGVQNNNDPVKPPKAPEGDKF